MSKIIILTDSCCDLPKETIEELGIKVLPFTLTVNGESFREIFDKSTQEVYDLMYDNMYNANWGYQNGRVRNARVRKTHEPVAYVQWDFKPSDKMPIRARSSGAAPTYVRSSSG